MNRAIDTGRAHGKGGRKALTPEDEAQIVTRIRAKERRVAIAAEFGVHVNTIRNIVNRHKSAPGTDIHRGSE